MSIIASSVATRGDDNLSFPSSAVHWDKAAELQMEDDSEGTRERERKKKEVERIWRKGEDLGERKVVQGKAAEGRKY